jgi:hypothetical protein
MRETKFLFAMVAFLAIASLANADIIQWNCADDGDGGIVMQPATLTDTGTDYLLEMSGVQNFHPAHIAGDFTTDTELDPTVWIVENVDNQTGFTWTDYHIDIGMNKPFSIVGVVAPLDWTWSITGPADGLPLPGDISPGLGWVGTVDFFAGTPIPVGQSGSFGLVVSFAGSVAFSTAQVPTPEPTTMALLGLGATVLLRKRSR